MSRYYDPVTHRFINADGYFQAGNGILDANTFAYCGNNPVNYSDSTGEHSSSVTCGDPTCTQCRSDRREFINTHLSWYNRVMGYTGTKDEVTKVEKNGDITTIGVFRKACYTIGAIIFSAELDADIGAGIGGSVTDIVQISALAKWSPLAIHFDEQNFYLGMKASSELGTSIAGVDLIGWDYSNFYDYLSGQNIEHLGESHNVGISAGAYVGVGGSISIGWNLDYIFNRCSQIW